MFEKKIFELHADACKALAHPLRIEVIDILRNKELCFSDILKKTGGLKSNLSQHLSIMTEKGILKMKRDGRCNYYSLSSSKVAKAYSLIREMMVDNLKEHTEILKNFK